MKAWASGRRQGFTLLEILAAATILSILMLILFSFFEQTTRAWQGSEKKIDAYREARAALYFLARDLQSMVVDDRLPLVWNQNWVGISGSLAPAAHADRIFFISRQPAGAQESGKNRGELCAVGYYLAYSPDLRLANDDLGRASYKLHRYFYSSDDTWSDNVADPSTGTLGIYPLLRALQEGPMGGSQRAQKLYRTAVGTANGDEVIARNVMDFFVTPMDENGQELAPWPETKEPAVIDIELTALSYDTASKLSSQSEWEDTSSAVFLRNSQRFATRVALPR